LSCTSLHGRLGFAVVSEANVRLLKLRLPANLTASSVSPL
jgi:hypothetical protein